MCDFETESYLLISPSSAWHDRIEADPYEKEENQREILRYFHARFNYLTIPFCSSTNPKLDGRTKLPMFVQWDCHHKGEDTIPPDWGGVNKL